VRLSLGDSHNADAAFECFAADHNLNKLTRSREVASIKICPGLVFTTLEANMTNVVGHAMPVVCGCEKRGRSDATGPAVACRSEPLPQLLGSLL
jgi:hypothetical protein